MAEVERAAARGAWRPGDDPGGRQFVAVGPLDLETGGRLPEVDRRLRDLGHAQRRRGDNAVLVEHALTGDSHVSGPAGPGPPDPGLVGRADRPGPAARHRPLVRRRLQRPRRLPGHDRAVVRRPGRAALGLALPVRHRARPGRGRGPAGRPARHRALGRRRRRLDGRHALAGVGGHPSATGWRPPIVLASTPYATAEQIAWCAPQLAAIRSDPDFNGGDYYDQHDRARSSGWASPAASPT